MSKVKVALLSVALLSISLSAVAVNQQINVKEGWPATIDGSNPCYVSHSWTIPLWYVGCNGVKAAWDALQSAGLDIKLYVDGEEWPCDRITPRMIPGDTPPDTASWRFGWIWRFPPNFFEEGEHLFVIDFIAPWGSPVEHVVEIVYE